MSWSRRSSCGAISRSQKKRPQEARPEAVRAVRETLHLLLRALLGCVVPRAASFIATSLVGCFRHVSGKGRSCEGQSYGHGERRNKSFHGILPLRITLQELQPEENARICAHVPRLK